MHRPASAAPAGVGPPPSAALVCLIEDAFTTFLRLKRWQHQGESGIDTVDGTDSQPSSVIRKVSAEFRQSLNAAVQDMQDDGTETSDGGAVAGSLPLWEVLEGVSSMWHLSEVCLFRSSGEPHSHTALVAVLEWLQQYFASGTCMSEDELSLLSSRLLSDQVATEVLWNAVARCVLTGQPHLASPLIFQCSRLNSDPHAVSLAELLDEFPNVLADASAAHSATAGRWRQWRGRVVGYLATLPQASAGDSDALIATRAILETLACKQSAFEDPAPQQTLPAASIVTSMAVHGQVPPATTPPPAQFEVVPPAWDQCLSIRLLYSQPAGDWSAASVVAALLDALKGAGEESEFVATLAAVAAGELQPAVAFAEAHGVPLLGLFWVDLLATAARFGLLRGPQPSPRLVSRLADDL
ncbi:unnamed protein product, partial [Symbiodinium sp. KB8]